MAISGTTKFMDAEKLGGKPSEYYGIANKGVLCYGTAMRTAAYTIPASPYGQKFDWNQMPVTGDLTNESYQFKIGTAGLYMMTASIVANVPFQLGIGPAGHAYALQGAEAAGGYYAASVTYCGVCGAGDLLGVYVYNNNQQLEVKLDGGNYARAAIFKIYG